MNRLVLLTVSWANGPSMEPVLNLAEEALTLALALLLLLLPMVALLAKLPPILRAATCNLVQSIARFRLGVNGVPALRTAVPALNRALALSLLLRLTAELNALRSASLRTAIPLHALSTVSWDHGASILHALKAVAKEPRPAPARLLLLLPMVVLRALQPASQFRATMALVQSTALSRTGANGAHAAAHAVAALNIALAL
jgi:hypothetical protein